MENINFGSTRETTGSQKIGEIDFVPGDLIGSVLAEDDDFSDELSAVFYRVITSTGGNRFVLNQTNGQLYVNISLKTFFTIFTHEYFQLNVSDEFLDVDTNPSDYELEIEAYNSDFEKTATAIVKISVEDVNNKLPEFKPDQYFINE